MREPNSTPTLLALFKRLARPTGPSQDFLIGVDDLLDAYEQVAAQYHLSTARRSELASRLHWTSSSDGSRLVHIETQTIGYASFLRFSKHFMRTRPSQPPALTHIQERPLTPRWDRDGIAALSCVADLVAICAIVAFNAKLPTNLIVARVSAIVILNNMVYILAPLVCADFIPDVWMVRCSWARYAAFYHALFGIKIAVASAAHVAGHILQVRSTLLQCVGGCDAASIYIVRESELKGESLERPVVISARYFAAQYPYYTGAILLAILGALIALNRFRCVRYSIGKSAHQYLAAAMFVMTILHGCGALLGFNYSLLMVLPPFVLYVWRLRREIFTTPAKILRWSTGPDTIQLYLEEDENLSALLVPFGCVSVYTKYPQVSGIEWHPFTLARGYGPTSATLYVSRVGTWTNALAAALVRGVNSSDIIHIGRVERSCFRFHRYYRNRVFFCAGVGISAFVASMMDMVATSDARSIGTELVWSVPNVEIISLFAPRLLGFQASYPNLKISIYYSNRRREPPSVDLSLATLKFEFLQSLIHAHGGVDIVTGDRSPAQCFLRRAPFSAVLAHVVAIEQRRSHVREVGVFACGSSAYASAIEREVDTLNRSQTKVLLKYWAEFV